MEFSSAAGSCGDLSECWNGKFHFILSGCAIKKAYFWREHPNLSSLRKVLEIVIEKTECC